jgi:hypothetical protein
VRSSRSAVWRGRVGWKASGGGARREMEIGGGSDRGVAALAVGYGEERKVREEDGGAIASGRHSASA